MELSKKYAYPVHEADEQEREKMMFHNPYQGNVLDSGADPDDQEVANTAILSAN